MILALIKGLEPEEVEEEAVAEWGVSPENVRELVMKAERRLAAWAEGPRGSLLTRAIEQVQIEYEKAALIEDLHKASQERRHWFVIRARLLGLFEQGSAVVPTGDADEEVERIRQHFLPFDLGPADLPVSELARLAAAELIRLRAGEERDAGSG